jgi:hypothetical protein
MSLIKVNSIEAYTGTTITFNNDVIFSNTGTTITFDNDVVLPNLGNSGPCNLGIDANGKVVSGSTNITDSIYTVNDNLRASGTTTATTSVMVYGVNVFTAVTSTNYATKLPQPVTGKSVKVINNGNTFLYVFPSNIGGQVNNLPINTPAVIPPDGNLYEFICIKNPLPGAWTFSAPATGQYDSGEISISISGLSQSGTNPVITAYDSSSVGITNQFSSTNWGYDGKNKPTITRYNNNGVVIAFRPEKPWKGIAKIKVYTNLVNGSRTRSSSVRLLAGGNVNYYSTYDGSFLSNGQGQDENELFNFFVNKPVVGNAVTASTQYTSAYIGDAATLWADKVAFSDQYNSIVNLGGVGGTFIGNKDLDKVPYPYGQTYDDSDNEINTGDIVDSAYSSYISFQIQPFAYDFNYGTIPDFKFRFIIEYYQ